LPAQVRAISIAAMQSLPITETHMNDELQIIDLLEGTGKAAVKGALITTQYTGTLEDGTVFDSSWDRGKPFQCVIGTGRVIKGWEQVFCM
jgi:peptidylprolyl isomerase